QDHRTLATSLATLYVQGVDIDWAGRDRPFDLRKVAIPGYPFQRKSYYLPPIADAGGVPSGRGHAWLGQKIVSPLLARDSVLYQAYFTADQPAFLREHKIFGRIISPAAAHLSMAFSAVRDLTGATTSRLDDVAFTAPLVVDDDEPRTVQMIIEGIGGAEGGFRLVSRPAEGPDAPWQTHCAGRIAAAPIRARTPVPADLSAHGARCPGRMAHDAFYALIETAGYSTGPNFRCLRDIQQGADESWCRLEATGRIDDSAIHPGLIDSILQTVLPACETSASAMLTGDSVLIPLHIGSIRLLGSLAGSLYCHTRIIVATGLVKATVVAYGADGVPVLEIDDFLLKQTDRTTLYQQMRRDDRGLIHTINWQEIPAPADPATEAPGWIILTEPVGWGAALAATLRVQEARCLELNPGDGFERLDSDHYALNLAAAPSPTSDLAGLLADWTAAAPFATIRIVLAATGPEDATAAAETADGLEADHEKWCGTLLALVQTLSRYPVRPAVRLWIMTRQAHSVVREDRSIAATTRTGGALWALGRTLSHEYPELWGGLVDVEDKASDSGVAALATRIGGAGETGGEDHLALRRGTQWFGARLGVAANPVAAAGPVPVIGDSEAYFLDVGPRHTLDDLIFKTRARRAPADHEVEVTVLAAGLNFRDVLNALGQYPGDAGLLGFEAVGTIARRGAAVTDLAEGDAVIVLASPGCIGSHVTVDRILVIPKPQRMSFNEAVTLPATFLTAHYALNVLGKMRRGDRILIHAAAGGVGLAAVQLAQRAGAEIFATVGSAEKRAHLRALGVTHLLNSRSTDFAAEIRALTGGAGVDIVLNSLSGDFITASFSVLARGGRFLEMGKIGIWDADRVAALDPTIFYRPFDLAAVLREDPALIAAMVNELLPLFESGALRPLPVSVFPLHQAEHGFRYMAQARHIGKIVLAREDEERKALMRRRGPVTADASYLITGGLGALGLRLAQWLHEEGARHLILVGRRAPAADASAIIAALRQDGVEVETIEADIAVAADVARVFARIDATTLPLKGVIHAAGLLDDGMIADLTWARFRSVMAPKLRGAWHLHQATRNRNLDFFVLFSSVAAVIGNLGQGNYAAANGFMDGLAAERRRLSLPATSVNWGPWAESGMAASMSGDRFATMGIRSLNPDQALRVLKQVLKEDLVQPVIVDADWRAFTTSQGLEIRGGLYATVAVTGGAAAETRSAMSNDRNIIAELREVLAIERPGLLRRYLQELARHTLGYGEGEPIALDQPLVAQGFDSLMSVDMRNRLNRSLGRTLPASLLFDYPTLDKIATFLLDDVIALDGETAVEAVPNAAAPSATESAQSLLREIAELVSP
ncbi:MAG: SDR family NAD(P)-dependent oxidoreductase, partial [Azospirillaceae bacterium]|nr:SDR family NAD(P)-dependent oxidoreductase [Azospirillaceae bacterium]